MKAALISPNEPVYSYDGTLLGGRVAQVEPAENIFPVAEGMFWVDCDDSVAQDQFYWDGNSIIALPVPPLAPAQQSNTVVNGEGGPNVVA